MKERRRVRGFVAVSLGALKALGGIWPVAGGIGRQIGNIGEDVFKREEEEEKVGGGKGATVVELVEGDLVSGV